MPPKYAAFAFVLLSWVVAWATDLDPMIVDSIPIGHHNINT
jgi:hypothetical protein